ncbi:MAG: protein TonB [Cyclobacteriaceae bacterium]|jgi:protein TonB
MKTHYIKKREIKITRKAAVILLFALSLLPSIVQAQESDTTTIEEVFTIVERQPEYPGGMSAFYKFVGDNLKYPKEAKRAGVQGRVYVQFVIDQEGRVTAIKTVKGIGYGCDEEAERLMGMTELWFPGTQNEVPDKVRMVLPIIFRF